MMPGRKPNDVGRITALAVCALAALSFVGCAGWRVPRIDPSGERFLIWPGEVPGAVVGAPVATTGPTYSPTPPGTIPAQAPLVAPGPPTGPVQAAPVWPDPNATSVFPNGVGTPHWAGQAGIPTLVQSENGPVIIPVCPDVTVCPPTCPEVCPPTCPPTCPPEIPTAYAPQPVIISGPAVAGPPGPVDQVVLSPRRLLAPVGSEVVLRAGICTNEGHLISNQRIEWMLANEGAGQFVEVGEPCWAHPFTKPKKIDNHYALGRTHGKTFTISRGTPDPSDDVLVRDGESWISVTSPIEGTSIVTAVAKQVDAWDKRKATATIYWVDAQWIFPPPTGTSTGTAQTLTTTVTRRTDGSPVAGYQVRYEVLDRGAAGFSPDGAEVVDVATNALGQATVEISQSDPQATSARVAISVIRPAGLGANERIVLGSGQTTVLWAAPDINIQSAGPPRAAVGANVTYQIQITNPGAATARDVIVSADVPQNLTYVGSEPQATSAGRRVEWALGDLGSGQARTINVEYRVERTGNINHCATVRTGDGLRVESCAATQVDSAEAVLDIQMTGPSVAEVGGIAPFEVVVINRGSAPANDLVIVDRFDQGLEHPGDTEHTHQIERSLGDLQPGQSTQPITITFNVTDGGRQCHEVEVRGAGGIAARRSACVEVRGGAVDITPPVMPDDNVNPPQGAALEVEKIPPRRAQVGDRVLFKMVVTNTGSVALRNVTVEEVYPPELKPLQATDGSTTDGRLLRWVIDELPVGGRRVFEIEYECLAATSIEGARTVATASVGNLVNSDQANVEIVPRAIAPPGVGGAGDVAPPNSATQSDLELHIAKYDDTVRVGDRTLFSISIDNKGRLADNNLRLDVAFPPELTPDVERINQTLRAQSVRATVAGQVLQFSPISEIRPGETISLTLSFNINRPGAARIQARLVSDRTTEPMTVEESVSITPR